jgi:hypothetical protein
MKEFQAQLIFISNFKAHYNLHKLMRKPSNIVHWDHKKKCRFNLRWIIKMKHLDLIYTKVKILRNRSSLAQEKIVKRQLGPHFS